MHVTRLLQEWYAGNKRNLPWRETHDPYRIWLSEIILQQTRVIQGVEYYRVFISLYPSVKDLASAPLDNVLKTWQGLGYYTRARNLHETARYVSSRFQGTFPGSYEGLLELKGIGRYTAAAIASMAYGEPVAVVDGNVSRVLSRLFGIDLPVNSSAGREMIYRKASGILDRENPGLHNQAIMEFGALVCTPRNPGCRECPLSGNCIAFRTDRTGMLPVRPDKKKIRERHFNYFHITHQDQTWIRKRILKDIWHSLYEFPLVETAEPCNWDDLSGKEPFRELFGTMLTGTDEPPRQYSHKLTHQTIHCRVFRIRIPESFPCPEFDFLKISLSALKQYPVPRLLERYLADCMPECRL